MKALALLTLCLTLACGAPTTQAQQPDGGSAPEESSDAAPAAQRADQVLYKGVVGNLLEAVPMDPDQRVHLQRGNAVVSAPLSARSLALLIGITNPVVMIGGLIWGIWSATHIEAPQQEVHAPEARAEIARVDLAADAAPGE